VRWLFLVATVLVVPAVAVAQEMNDSWMREHWVFLVIGAAILGPLISSLLQRIFNKAADLDKIYVLKEDYEKFEKFCEKQRLLCIQNQDKCGGKMEKMLEIIQHEIRANRMATFWLADHLVPDPKQIFELRKIVEGYKE
jgi:hypothetical protein